LNRLAGEGANQNRAQSQQPEVHQKIVMSRIQPSALGDALFNSLIENQNRNKCDRDENINQSNPKDNKKLTSQSQ
jgi:hypothetical protein